MADSQPMADIKNSSLINEQKHETVEQEAQRLGVSPRTIYRRRAQERRTKVSQAKVSDAHNNTAPKSVSSATIVTDMSSLIALQEEIALAKALLEEREREVIRLESTLAEKQEFIEDIRDTREDCRQYRDRLAGMLEQSLREKKALVDQLANAIQAANTLGEPKEVSESEVISPDSVPDKTPHRRWWHFR